MGDRIWHSTLDSIMLELKNKQDDVRVSGAKNLRNYVYNKAREMSGETFSLFMNDLNRFIMELVNSNSPQEKLSGISVVYELIELDFDDATKTNVLANNLRQPLKMTLSSMSDSNITRMAAKTLGRLAQISGLMIAEYLQSEVKRALEWITSERSVLAAVLIIKELAQNAPTIFYIHVFSFFDKVWYGLRDPRIQVRDITGEALRASLQIMAERERLNSTMNNRLEYTYHKMYEEAQKGLKNSDPVFIHGSLVALGELLLNTGNFLQSKHKEVCETVLGYKDLKDKLIRRTVISFLPQLAAFNPQIFASNYLSTTVKHLLSKDCHKDEFRAISFLSIGELALASPKEFVPHVPPVISKIKDTLHTKSKVLVCPEALTCLGLLAKALKSQLSPHIEDLLPLIFSVGLSNTLAETLVIIAKEVPSQLPQLQDKLLGVLSGILASNKPSLDPSLRKIGHISRSIHGFSDIASKLSSKQNLKELTKQEDQAQADELVALALMTLGSFGFETNVVIDLTRECVVTYLEDDNDTIRKEAALTCSKLIVVPSLKEAKNHYQFIGEILEKLMIVGISDPNAEIRRTVLANLHSQFDDHLAQAENLRSLLIALNDELFENRELAITAIGRLSIRNPAFVMPVLRKTMIHLLSELEYSDSKNKEECSKLLGHLIKASRSLIKPYSDPILKAFLPKLQQNPSPRLLCNLLASLGELSTLGGGAHLFVHHFDVLLPTIIDALQDQTSTNKRQIALRSFSQIINNTGYVIKPYKKYPQLLEILLNEIRTEQNVTVRKEILEVLGLLGALDPHRHKLLKLSNHREATEQVSKNDDELLASMAPSASNYYPMAAIIELTKILRDPSLSTHHTLVIQSVMKIIKGLGGAKGVPFLAYVMPPILQAIKTCEPTFREFLFKELGMLVSIVKQHIQPYLNEIFQLIHEFWKTELLFQILTLVEEVSTALNEEFKGYLPKLIPQMFNVLNTDTSNQRQLTQKVLHALEVFGTNLEDYLNLTVPTLVKLFEEVDAPVGVRMMAIQVVGRLCKKLNFSEFASRIIHPLARCLETDDLRNPALDTLCALIYQLEADFAIFIPMINKTLAKRQIQHPGYETLVTRLLKNQPLKDTVEETSSSSLVKRPRSSSFADRETTVAIPQDISELMSDVKFKINEESLRKAWEISPRSTKDDWIEWSRRFSIELVRESPSPAFRHCLSLVQLYYPLARELFNPCFHSCWSDMSETSQKELVKTFDIAFESQNTPPEIMHMLLSLCEFMEHDEKPLPINFTRLGNISADSCHAYAKALHYKEMDFESQPHDSIESLILINNELQQPEAAEGILAYARKHNIEVKETWYENLRRWKDALESYEKKLKSKPQSIELNVGKLRCLHALGEWDELARVSKSIWGKVDGNIQIEIAPLAAAASWNLGDWDSMRQYVEASEPSSIYGSLFRAVLYVQQNNFELAVEEINTTRLMIEPELRASASESYHRAYKSISRLQALTELEEVIEYKKTNGNMPEGIERRGVLRRMWDERLRAMQQNVDIWQQALAIQGLVIKPVDNMDLWLKWASLCQKNGRQNLCQSILQKLASVSKEDYTNPSLYPTDRPELVFSHLKLAYNMGKQDESLKHLNLFVKTIKNNPELQSRCYSRIAQWIRAKSVALEETQIPQTLGALSKALENAGDSYKVWHTWALMNFEAISFYEKVAKNRKSPKIGPYLVPAINGFFRSISIRPRQTLQDALRVLSLMFKYGSQKDVEAALLEGFNTVSIDTWLEVIPQIIARLHSSSTTVRRLIITLLSNVGKEHPQALVYPMTVATQSQSHSSASIIMEKIRAHRPALVEQAETVSRELIRVSILWHEMWHEAIEEAWKMWSLEKNADAMFATIAPLQQLLVRGPQTFREIAFTQAYGIDLFEAAEWGKRYRKTKNISDLNAAWDLYSSIHRTLTKTIPQDKILNLQYISPALLEAHDLELAIPGTYQAGEEIVRIASFDPILSVIISKQRPRRLGMKGSDGSEYMFLLKGHEDLRQDERVMQLFGLVNTLLASDRETTQNHLALKRYAVIPLSQQSGLIGWVPGCDTLYTLITNYRKARNIVLNLEHKSLMQMAPLYDKLPLIQKVENFNKALESTPGQDINRTLYLKSRNSEVWFERRITFTRSLALMSMVGYILGLGDRHPNNLMMERSTGKIIHIDFGDCFEVAMHREKLPEKIPFRLTRMLIKAMEASGIEGTFRSTCENVMRVMRDNKDSLMAVLEAFVYDPLINWRLIATNETTDHQEDTQIGQVLETEEELIVDEEEEDNSDESIGITKTKEKPTEDKRKGEGDEEPKRKGSQQPEEEEEVPEVLNERAVQVITRIAAKLTGTDFGVDVTLTVSQQIERLIHEATSSENLCQGYMGWCPFW